jgi:hypothetical protein
MFFNFLTSFPRYLYICLNTAFGETLTNYRYTNTVFLNDARFLELNSYCFERISKAAIAIMEGLLKAASSYMNEFLLKPLQTFKKIMESCPHDPVSKTRSCSY